MRDDSDTGIPGVATEPRKRKRLVWPLALVAVLAASSLTIARAATLPPLTVADYRAVGQATDAAQAPVGAAVPTAGPLSSAAAEPFGPQLEVILPPPPPPPAAPGKASAQQRKAAAAALTTTQYCDGEYGATSTATSVEGLLAAANAERANFGLGALSWSGPLAQSAQDWSNHMTTAYDPASPHGNVPSPGGQNIMYSWSIPPNSESAAMAIAHARWMKSPGHCKNILRASFTSMGAATASVHDDADGSTAWYTTVNFQ